MVTLVNLPILQAGMRHMVTLVEKSCMKSRCYLFSTPVDSIDPFKFDVSMSCWATHQDSLH